MLFFRVENDNRNGPYTSNSLDQPAINCYRAGMDHHHDNFHPGPNNDPLLGSVWNNFDNYRDYIFGFSSLDKLFNWFLKDEDLEYLTKYKFKISCYESDLVHEGTYQSVTKRTDIKTLVDSVYF